MTDDYKFAMIMSTLMFLGAAVCATGIWAAVYRKHWAALASMLVLTLYFVIRAALWSLVAFAAA